MPEGHSPKVQQFVGYTTRRWAAVLYPLLTILTGGLLWVVGQRYLQAKLWTLQKCSLSKAQYVHVKFVTGRQELVEVLHQPVCEDSYLSATQRQISPGSTAPALHLISLLLVVYIYDASEDSFKVVPDMPVNTSIWIHNAQKALQHIQLGAEWSRLCPMSSRHRHETMCLYGMNDMSVMRPSMLRLAGAVLAYPPFIVQYFELACMFYLKFYMVASCLLFMTLASSFVSTYKLYKKRSELFHAVGQQRLIPIVLAGRVRATSSKKLVPGDVIVVVPGRATCDLVLLQGTCLVEESNLSGEAAQVRKSSFVEQDESHGRAYHPQTHHSHTIHAGTSVQQTWADSATDDEVLGMVVRTGLRTTVGNMLRQIVAPLHELSLAKDPFLSDLFSFCGFALILQLCIFLVAAVPHFWTHQQSASECVGMVLGTVMTALPVAVPTVILGANAACMARLKQRGIDVLMVAKLKTIAAVEMICFDKTGTLTGSVAELHGLVPVEQGSFTGLQSVARRWPNRLKQALAVCNSLTLIGRNQLVGDDADKQAFQAVEARFLDRDRVSLPLAALGGEAACVRTLQVLKRFEYDPALNRSGVVARDKSVHRALLFVRGAPHKVVGLVKGGALPPDFDQVVLEYAGQSFRLLALAAGTLRRVTAERLASMSQQEAEAECDHMDLLALIVLSNSAHSTSRPAITSLQERGGIRTMMITGDYQHTAIAVARGVGMIAVDSQVVVMEAKSERVGSASAPVAQHTAPLTKPGLTLQRPGERTGSSTCQHLTFTLDRGGGCEEVDSHTAITSLAQGSVRCCVTGPALEHILQKADAPLVETIMRSLVVCARMRSHQKAQVMDLLGPTGLYLSPGSNDERAQPHYMPDPWQITPTWCPT
ncbi:hypothetical protein WJX77_006172 [Trebouxia sp. C0004]